MSGSMTATIDRANGTSPASFLGKAIGASTMPCVLQGVASAGAAASNRIAASADNHRCIRNPPADPPLLRWLSQDTRARGAPRFGPSGGSAVLSLDLGQYINYLYNTVCCVQFQQ